MDWRQNHLSGEKLTKNKRFFFTFKSHQPLYLNQSGITTLQCKSIPSTRWWQQFEYRDENPRKSHKRTMEPPKRKSFPYLSERNSATSQREIE
jgi:hypothetical protein